MAPRRSIASLFACAAVFAASATAHAGLEAMLAGDPAAGCPKIARSFEMEPLAGALFTLAECEAKWGKSGSALHRYERYLEMLSRMSAEERSRSEERRVTAQRQIETLRAQLASLEIALPDDGGEGELRIDDEVVPKARRQGAVYVKAGRRVLSYVTADGREHRQTVTVAAGERRRVELEADMPPAAAAEAESPGEADAPGDDGATQRTIAYVVGGLGLVGVVVGAVTGGLALGEGSTVADACVDSVCSAEGKDAADAGQTLADISTVTFIVGAVGIGVGATLWLTAPSSDSGAQTQARGAMLSVGGVW
jgi:hypothetical protein